MELNRFAVLRCLEYLRKAGQEIQLWLAHYVILLYKKSDMEREGSPVRLLQIFSDNFWNAEWFDQRVLLTLPLLPL